jgi:predicted DNA-binding protein (MmcQ/YjbR family)
VTREQVIDLCSSLPGVVEDHPFGSDVAVFKVEGKMFALVSLTEEPGTVNLKCHPEWALELRARHEAVRPGYHQTSATGTPSTSTGTIEDAKLRDMIDHSYELVVSGLPRNDEIAFSDVECPAPSSAGAAPRSSPGLLSMDGLTRTPAFLIGVHLPPWLRVDGAPDPGFGEGLGGGRGEQP